MITIITLLILVACIVLGFFILVQNPKGGGLSGSFGTMGAQVMGVKQSGDIMEKGTWILISAVAGLCIISVMFMDKTATDDGTTKAQQQKSAPAKKK